MTHDKPNEAPAVTEAIARGRAKPLRIDRFRLHVADGVDAGLVYESSGPRTVIGTHASADLVLQDPSVSRFHCELVVAPTSVTLRDLGSLNGTAIDNVSVVEAPLRAGATLSLGRTKVRFEPDGAKVEVPVSARDRFGLAVGRAPAMSAVFSVLERAAPTDATVLIEGETGTGKEVIAESIHNESARREGPFVVVDCGAIPRDLLESELFGHEKGAFTGAVASREGAFEAASGGTLFLDEIGELSADLQPKLLRALERREVKRVGSNKYVKVDVRVVAATNRNLREQVNHQAFRPDLFYRLAVVQVRLPPLRERVEDLPILVEHVLASLGAATRPEATMLRTPEFAAEIARHAWPGNVRELRNYLERCLALSEAVPLAPGDDGAAQPQVDSHVPLRVARERWVRAFERRYVEEIMRRCGDNVTEAARAAGLARNHFYRLLWRYSLR